MWSMFVNGLSWLLAQLAHGFCGSYGLAVITMAVVVRLLLLPMTLHVAEQSWYRQAKLMQLKPKLDQLRERYATDPSAYALATQALYRKHRITSGLGSGMLTALVQTPLVGAMYAAIRQSVAATGSFLWIARLTRPDVWLTLVVTLLTYAAIALNPTLSEQARTAVYWLPVIVTFLVTWHLSAALGLYWAGSSGVGVLQAALLRRRIHRAKPLSPRDIKTLRDE
jgi:YidC/Oxa1 family membrane protein insertase